MDYPNKGTLWYQTEKKTEKSPDFTGNIKLDKYMLLDIIENSEGSLIEIAASGWRGKVNTKFGEKHVINLSVSKPMEKTNEQPAQSQDDSDIPF